MIYLILAAAFCLQDASMPAAGSISGVVVNASQARCAVGNAKVVLRVKVDGQFIVAAEGEADASGRFVFENIPADPEYIYLPGANHQDVHYPGPRVVLTEENPHARLELPVHDSVNKPNPLVLRRHEIEIYPQVDTLRIRETLLIENPSLSTYVGEAAVQDGRAATLRLGVSPDFLRTTFHEEFFGRQFTLYNGELVTDVPWTPGTRELALTYIIPNQDKRRVWTRALDLPCEHLCLIVHTERPDEVVCNLSRSVEQNPGSVRFESTGGLLPAQHRITLELGRMPLSASTYAPWLAAVVLVLLIAASFFFGNRYRNKPASPRVAAESKSPQRAA